MPSEPMSLLLRPRNFFERNPCMDGMPPEFPCCVLVLRSTSLFIISCADQVLVPPSFAITPSEVKAGKKGCSCGASKESVLV